MTGHFLILDCFVDEPACLGVPPFVSPYPRYIYGALVCAGIDPSKITYETIEELRERDYRLRGQYATVFMIGGAVVPGRYLGSRIGTAAETGKILSRNPDQEFAVGGLISRVLETGAGNALLVRNDIEKYAFTAALGRAEDSIREPVELAPWAGAGAAIASLHPGRPDLIFEIETYRGCPRERHCSFCSEGLIKEIQFREPGHILEEIDELIRNGATRFRLGRQADILQYRSSMRGFRGGFPKPDPAPIRELFRELKSRMARGDIRVLNIDNANPGTIAHFPELSARILESIADTITPGDTLALGVESFDPEVVRANSLKVNGDEAERAVRLVNDVGGHRVDGIPVLLPGINLLHGLRGESDTTFEVNYRRLVEMRDRGLLVKRINTRQVQPFPGTPCRENRTTISSRVRNRFEFYREKIRREVEHPMLERIYPAGTVLKEVNILETRSGVSYGKQIRSYAITGRFPLELEKGIFLDGMVTGHRERSVDVLPCPIRINSLPQKGLEAIPGIGRKKSSGIIMRRPFSSREECENLLEGVPESIASAIVTG